MSVLCGKLTIGCDCDSKTNAGGTVSIQIFNLHDSQTGDVADAESLSFSVFQYDSELQVVGDAVAGASGGMTNGGGGRYFGTIDKTAAFERSSDYWLTVSDSDSGLIFERVFSTF